ncbi:hypothetical protein LTR17_003815 [Elasticomyces elasticus]|nr:hypothetical protein LTR17_003815 [Elasticomyces elasticus]
MPFDLANSLRGHHLIVQPSDLALNPPESYLYTQDGLIISCGVLYVLCYLFYMIRTYKDRFLAGHVEYLCGTMAYEIYYAFTTTSTNFELYCFLAWFLFDACFAAVAITSAYPREQRSAVTTRMVIGVGLGVAFLHWLCQIYPDERQQLTGYWTGALLELPIGWGALYYLVQRGDTKGQSLEIWMTRILGCILAFAVFIWRYVNVPQNWEYVGSWSSIATIFLTLLPEFIHPFVYLRVYKNDKTKTA